MDTRKELAEAVGLGERTMGKVMQIDENAPEVIKEALDKKELSINKGYDLTGSFRTCRKSSGSRRPPKRWNTKKQKKELEKAGRRDRPERKKSRRFSAKRMKKPSC